MAKMRVDQLKYDNKHIQVKKSTVCILANVYVCSLGWQCDCSQTSDNWQRQIFAKTRKHITPQASLINAQNKRQKREQELAEREQLLNRRFGHDHTEINVDYLAQEQASLQNSHRHVDDMLHTGTINWNL